MNDFDQTLFGGRSPFPGFGRGGLLGLMPMSTSFPPLLGGGFDRGDTVPALLGDTSLDEDVDDTALALPFSMGDVATRAAGALAPPMRIDVEETDNKYLVTAEGQCSNKHA